MVVPLCDRYEVSHSKHQRRLKEEAAISLIASVLLVRELVRRCGSRCLKMCN